MPLCRHRLSEVDGVDAVAGSIHHDIGVRRDGRGDEEERLPRIDGLV